MKIWVLVKPNARKEKVETLPDGTLRFSVRAPATEGKANEALIDLVARHFSGPKGKVAILVGLKGRKKLIEV